MTPWSYVIHCFLPLCLNKVQKVKRKPLSNTNQYVSKTSRSSLWAIAVSISVCNIIFHIGRYLPGAEASPRIFLSGGRIVGRVANLPQNTLKIGKTPDFGHFILESGGQGSTDQVFKSAGVRTPPPSPTPVGDAPGTYILYTHGRRKRGGGRRGRVPSSEQFRTGRPLQIREWSGPNQVPFPDF